MWFDSRPLFRIFLYEYQCIVQICLWFFLTDTIGVFLSFQSAISLLLLVLGLLLFYIHSLQAMCFLSSFSPLRFLWQVAFAKCPQIYEQSKLCLVHAIVQPSLRTSLSLSYILLFLGLICVCICVLWMSR